MILNQLTGGVYNDIDLFTYSFPCQDISNQGLQKGFDKKHNTRSGLLWEIERILKELKKSNKLLPKYLLAENVKAILSHKYQDQYNFWLKSLAKLGYESKTYCLNSINFHSPQNRERVFILSVRTDWKQKTSFDFVDLEKIITKQKLSLKSIIDTNDQKFDHKINKYKLIDKQINKNNIHKLFLENYSNFSSENYAYDINYSGPTLTASSALSRIKLFFSKNKIRSINPLESFRYMGFRDVDYFNVKKTNLINNTKMIFLCGNSIVVNVLEAIFKTLKFEV